MNRTRTHPRGITAVLAMLYLVIFSTLAIGFFAATSTQSQIVNNDQRVARALTACESGMDFMRYQLGRVYIPPEPLPPEQVLEELYTDLDAQLTGTGNLAGQSIEWVGNTIQIPANGGFINLDSSGHSKFRATITDWAGEIVVKIDGQNGTTSASRAITMDFTRVPHETTVFDYAVASKGQILMKKGEVTSVSGVDPRIANMMSVLVADPSIVVTGGTIGGDLSIVTGADVTVTGGSVGGSSIPSVILADHVNRDVDPPEFPTINTQVYEQYATNTYVPGVPLKNIRIPPNTNPKFTGNKTIQGIMYVESPNKVEFTGNVTLQGFIVFQNLNHSGVNSLAFTGSLDMQPVPAEPEFDELRATSGVAILGPTTAMSMTGSADFIVRGNLIVGKFASAGAANVHIDQGTLMTYDEVPNTCVFDSSKGIRFTATGGNNVPTQGITYSTYYEPKPQTYQEVSP